MDSPCIKQTVSKVLKIFQYGKYLVAYVLKFYLLRKTCAKQVIYVCIYIYSHLYMILCKDFACTIGTIYMLVHIYASKALILVIAMDPKLQCLLKVKVDFSTF